MSDLKHRVTYELAGSEPAAPYASSVTKISLRPITDNDTTYIGTRASCLKRTPIAARLQSVRWLSECCALIMRAEWETAYSSDVTEAALTDSANQMLEAFKELDASLGASGSSATAGVSAAAIGAWLRCRIASGCGFALVWRHLFQ